MTTDDGDDLSRRRLLGGSASLGVLAAMAGCLDDADLDEFLGDDDDSRDDRRRDDESAGDEDDAPEPEPDDPPETVADGFDIDAALAATVEAIETDPFEVSGAQNDFDDPDGEAFRDAIAYSSIGEPADREGRLRYVADDERQLDHRELDAPEGATEIGDLFLRDGSFTVGVFDRDADPQYEHEDAGYETFTDESALPIERYHGAGVNYGFTFDEPRWDESAGVYVVEGTDVETDSIDTIHTCTLEVDRDGAVVGLDLDVEWRHGGRLRTRGEGAYGEPTPVPVPDWLAEAEERIDDPDGPDDPDDPDDPGGHDFGDPVDETGQATVGVVVGANDGFEFAPAHIRIDVGTSVDWFWSGGLSHTVTAVDGTFESSLQNDGGFRHTFTETGVYDYVCVPHQTQGMIGRIEVV